MTHCGFVQSLPNPPHYPKKYVIIINFLDVWITRSFSIRSFFYVQIIRWNWNHYWSHVLCYDIIWYFFSAWNCFKCLSLFDFLINSFLRTGQILLSATELRCRFIAKYDIRYFTMLFLYLEVVLHPAVGQMNEDSSLLNSTTLFFFCNQCPFNFSFNFYNTIF